MHCSFFNTQDIRGIKVPMYCQNEVVTFHGMTMASHGYCEAHRCCGKCGGAVNRDSDRASTCTCPDGHTERPEYIRWKQGQDPTWTPPGMLVRPGPAGIAFVGGAPKGPVNSPSAFSQAFKRDALRSMIVTLIRNTRNLLIPFLLTAVTFFIVAVSVYFFHAWAFLGIYPLCVILVTVIEYLPPPRD